MSVSIGKTLKIRECGYDEYWLQDQIFENPAYLGLGELNALHKERRQPSGGRVDILLIDPDDDSMYEVEVMLGETDESHIIRTIEYWDNESRRWPQRKHYAVIVAESVTRRFFNVIQLLSQTIPIIAIQANIIEASPQNILNFVKILDVYEEPDDGTTMSNEKIDKTFWENKCPWAIECTDYVEEQFTQREVEITRNHTRGYISLACFGRNRIWLQKRNEGKVHFKFQSPEGSRGQIESLLDGASISFLHTSKSTRLTTSLDEMKKHEVIFYNLFDLLISTWK